MFFLDLYPDLLYYEINNINKIILNFKVEKLKGPIEKQIIIPGSKSITNRALLLAFFAE